MLIPSKASNSYFWLLILLPLAIIGPGLVIGWRYALAWGEMVWQVCQSGLHGIATQLPATWSLIMPLLALVILIRGTLSLLRQVRATRQLMRLFAPLQAPVPTRLSPMLAEHGLQEKDLFFLNLKTPHAFCYGFRQPRIWLTSGLLTLLNNDELSAVLAHETYHYHHRDPLRLLIGRTVKAAFFFWPLVGDLAEAAELQQEIAADQAAIQQASDDLPLLCALQKLLTRPSAGATFVGAAYSPFNVTEARLRRLIYPAQPPQRPIHLLAWVLNIMVIVAIGSTLMLSPGPAVARSEFEHCTAEPINSAPSSLPWSGYGSYGPIR